MKKEKEIKGHINKHTNVVYNIEFMISQMNDECKQRQEGKADS